MELGSFIVMVVCFSIVGYATYWQSKREFNRRNNGGIELFESHTDMLKKKTLEYFVQIGGVPIGIVGLISAFVFMIALTK